MLKEPLLNKQENIKKKDWLLWLILICLFITIAFILSLSITFSNNIQAVVRVEDKRQFEIYPLNNGFEAFIIHNGTTPQNFAFVSISLPVGLLHDGDIQGLAHLVEHMSFYSSQKYQNEYNLFSFIQQKGGSFNAYTSFQETNYYYLIKNDSLKQSLDILGSFLLEPSLQEQDIIKEVNVIQEEWHFRASLFP